MTAKELIERLSALPPDAVVRVPAGDCCGCSPYPVDTVTLERNGSITVDSHKFGCDAAAKPVVGFGT